MKVILRANISSLGKIGDVVEVSEGYALNYLIPKKYAYAALAGNLRSIEEEKRTLAKRVEKEKKADETLAAEIEKVSVSIPVKVGEEDKIFGTVTSQMIADHLKEKGVTVDKRTIELEEPIKALGIHTVAVKLSHGVSAKVKVWVVKEVEEQTEATEQQ